MSRGEAAERLWQAALASEDARIELSRAGSYLDIALRLLCSGTGPEQHSAAGLLACMAQAGPNSNLGQLLQRSRAPRVLGAVGAVLGPHRGHLRSKACLPRDLHLLRAALRNRAACLRAHDDGTLLRFISRGLGCGHSRPSTEVCNACRSLRQHSWRRFRRARTRRHSWCPSSPASSPCCRSVSPSGRGCTGRAPLRPPPLRTSCMH